MADKKVEDEDLGGALKNADLIRYVEESGGNFTSKYHTLQSYKTFFNSGVVVAGNEFLSPESVAASADPAYTLGDGTAQTFASYGKTLGQAQADFPDAPITATTDLVDWAAIYQAEKNLENGGIQNAIYFGNYGSRKYIVNKPLYLPTTTSKSSKRFAHIGNGCEINGTGDTTIFESVPSDQTDADLYVFRQLYFENFYLTGSGGVKGNGQCGIRMGGGRHLTLKNCEINDCDINLDLMFCLFTGLEDCQLTNALTYNAWIHCGLDFVGSPVWTSASLSNSASNDCDWWNVEIFNRLLSDYGVVLQGVSDINFYGCTSEGAESGTQANQPIASIYYDDLDSTVVKGFVTNGFHIEQSYTDSIVKGIVREGMFQFNDWYNHKQGLYATENRMLWNFESTVGETFVNMQNLRYATAFQQFGVVGAAISKAYVRPDFTRCKLNGAPQTAGDLQADATLWDDQVPDSCSIIPLL